MTHPLTEEECIRVRAAIVMLLTLYTGTRRNGALSWLAKRCGIDKRQLAPSCKPTRRLVEDLARALHEEYGVTVERILSGNPLPNVSVEHKRRFGAIFMARVVVNCVERAKRELRNIRAMELNLEAKTTLPGWRHDGFGTAVMQSPLTGCFGIWRFGPDLLEEVDDPDATVAELEAGVDDYLAQYDNSEAAEIVRATFLRERTDM